MAKLFLSSIVLLAVLLTAPCCARAQQGGGYGSLQAQILTLVNKHRMDMGLGPLAMNSVISQAAEKHSRNMGSGRVPFGHKGFDERMEGITRQVKPANAWAENVAFGPDDAAAIVDMWLHSPGHRKNIEGDYNLTGLGIARGSDGSYYYTQIFINRK